MAGRNENADLLPHLRGRDGLAGALKEIAGECCTLAIQALARRPNEKAVHRVRQACKRARAILRLLEDAGVKDVASLRERLTVAARKFSKVRDATVTSKVAERLAGKLEGEARTIALRIAGKKPAPPHAAWWSQRRRELVSLHRAIARMRADELTARQIEESLRKSARRVERKACRARRDHDVDAAHAWRKKVIVLREQVGVAEPLLGRKAEELHARLQPLAKRLGQAVDQQVFLEALARRKSAGKGGKKLAAASRRKQKRLLKRARQCWHKAGHLLRRDFGAS